MDHFVYHNHSEIHFLSKNHSIYIDISNDLNFDSKLASLKYSARNGIHAGISCRHFFHATIIPPLDVQRSGQAQETVICLFGLLFFSQNGMTLKNLQKISKSYEKLVEIKWIILLLLKPKPSLEAE